MPLQNRVTPFGEIIADPARGTVMGNRGCLHDTGDQILRPYQVTRWIICKIHWLIRISRAHVILNLPEPSCEMSGTTAPWFRAVNNPII
jgi:hypothetical protein